MEYNFIDINMVNIMLNKIPNDIIKYMNEFFFIPKNKFELKIAVNQWINDKKNAIKKYGHISLWITTYITDMRNLFFLKYDFNDNISKWDVKNVINMSGMFMYCIKLNQNLNNWNINNVINADEMFKNCYNFNFKFNLNNWNLNKIIHKNLMFYNACNIYFIK